MFVDYLFVVEIGILRLSINRIGKINVVKGVENYYNENSEFYVREIEVYICAVFMEMVGMRKIISICK